MNLNVYVRSLFNNRGNTYTPTWLAIPAGLGQRFGKLTARCEKDVVERGYNLKWVPTHRGVEIETEPTLYEGDHNSVNLDSEKAHLMHAYIGDFHVHPYQKRYGEHVSIGPSSGDWTGWHEYFPKHKSCAIFMVASGTELHLVVFRSKPAVLQPSTRPDAYRLVQVRQGLDKYQNQDFTDAITNKDWAEYRRLLETVSPEGAMSHDEDVTAMNRELAENNGCEYYRGDLITNGVSYLYLKSNRLVGNWLTARVWRKPSSPWLHSKLF